MVRARFGGLGGSNGRQSWVTGDVLVTLSTLGPTHHMLLGVVGPLIVGMATNSPKNLLICTIFTTVCAMYQAFYMHLSLHWTQS